MQNTDVIVIGAGGHAKVVIATLQAAGLRPIEIYDDNIKLVGQNLLGISIKGRLAELKSSPSQNAFIAIGNNKVRKQISERFNFKWVTAVHPRAWVHSSVELGSGTLVCANCVIHPSSKIGSHSIINTSASIDHDNLIGDFSHIGPGAHTGGNVQVGEGSFIGMGSSLIQGTKVGAWSIIGAGAAVISNISPQVLAAGVPAIEKKSLSN